MRQLRASALFVWVLLESTTALFATAPDFVPSLTEPGEGLSVASASARTGYATFASSRGRGILLSVPGGASAEERALAFIRSYGHAFGIDDPSEVHTMRAPSSDDLGFEHVRLQQVRDGVPIRAAEMLVHMKGPRVMAVNGHAIRDFPTTVTPTVTADRARGAAQQLLTKRGISEAATATYSEPTLEILNRTLISGIGNDISHLAWFVEVTDFALREYIWIDAQTGGVLLSFSQLTEAKNRSVYNANHVSGTAALPGTLIRSEGGPPVAGDNDANNAYDYAGIVYDYYLNNHGRDSYDNAGSELRSSVHYCQDPNCPSFPNAFWSGQKQQMVYGDNYASGDDIVGHELTHAVTEKTAALLYYMQSGALNESFSDIFGETIDLIDGVGNDAAGVRWQMGEDLPIGAIRNMMDPTPFGDPAKMSDTNFKCYSSGWTAQDQDRGGVHSNSGVPNKAFALMVDGGTFNGKTVTGIGTTKAAKVEYRALSVYLTSGSGFLDDYNALNQSCSDLVGSVGIGAPDCVQVKNALDAVEMASPWKCGAIPPPAKCPTGSVIISTFEGFETSLGNWTSSDLAKFDRYDGLAAKSGKFCAVGLDTATNTNLTLTMTNAVAIPAGARMYFDHLYEFENDVNGLYDGGVIEYSTNGGATWNDAGPLIDAGAVYDGQLPAQTPNPLGAGRWAFTGTSYGYTGTRLNLANLAGQNVKFRFHIGTDDNAGSLGWLIDNVTLYRCGSFTDDPVVGGQTVIKAVHISELRDRINGNLALRGVAPASWTDALVGAPTLIKAVHISELRTALAAAYLAAGRTMPSFTDPTVTLGMTSKAAHINELRAAVIAIESAP